LMQSRSIGIIRSRSSRKATIMTRMIVRQQPANHGDALKGLTSNTPKGVTWLRLILQLPFALSSQVNEHFRPLVSHLFAHALTALRVFQRRWGSNGLGPCCERKTT